MQVLLHVLQGGSPVQRDSGVRVQPHAVLVHRRHIGRMIRGEDEVQSAQIEQNPGKPERHEQGEHELVWVSLPWAQKWVQKLRLIITKSVMDLRGLIFVVKNNFT